MFSPWSAKREQSADVFDELGEKEEEEEEEKKKVFVHGLWSSPRRWCALDLVMQYSSALYNVQFYIPCLNMR